MTDVVTYAAGGVLWRTAPDGIEIGIIHRPRYDDWTLPKGKTDPGETLIGTAVREISEETGFQVRLGRHLKKVAYDIKNGRKHVHYWAAEATGGEFEANDEVDEIRWCTADKASDLLSYRLDRHVLKDFCALPEDRLTTLLLVRHARAGRRSRYKGDDTLRPLDKLGRAQAEGIATACIAFGPTEIHSANRVRCEQTVAPLAQETGLRILTDATLSEEAYREKPKATLKRLRAIASHGGVPVVCSQGKVIPPVMDIWAEHDGLTLPKARNRKGSMWALSFLDNGFGATMVAAHHLDSLLPTTPLD